MTSDAENEAVVCHFVPIFFGEGGQFRVQRVTFVSNVSRENAAIWFQRPISMETAGVFNNFVSAQMVIPDLVLAIHVIQNDKIKLHLLIPECLPSLFQQCGGIRAVEHRTTVRRNGVQHRSQTRDIVRRESHHGIWTCGEVFQKADLVKLNVEFLLGLPTTASPTPSRYSIDSSRSASPAPQRFLKHFCYSLRGTFCIQLTFRDLRAL